MAGIVVGRDGPAGLHGVAPLATLLPIQVLELQHGDLVGTTATLLAGIDRALDPNGDGNLSDHADVILAPVAEPFAAFGASPETIAAEGAERAGAVLVAAAGNDGADRAPLRHDRHARRLARLARGRCDRRPRRAAERSA